ncbi:phosphodiesterase [Marinosulfonomonas sp. PRT-SC04]|nr:phosphodiesterase [Marinosulfonomonas sp. PRT-SC04]
MTTLSDSFLKLPFAHRGYHSCGRDTGPTIIENSRAAFIAAIDAGYGIELDVQLSADGHAMVFHDYELSRLTNQTGPVRTKKCDDLTQITLSNSSETIPTLPEILTLIAGRVPLLIETKDQDDAMGPDVGPLEKSVANALLNYDGPVAVMCFNPHSVLALADMAPNVPRGIVSSHFPAEHWPLLSEKTRAHLRSIPDYDRTGACFISHRHDDLENPRVADLKQAGARILCWTTRSPEADIQARKIADNVTFEGYAAQAPS